MRIERSVTIDRTVDDVFAFVSDPSNDRRWCPKVRSVQLVTGDAQAPGAEYLVVHRPVPVLPARRMSYTLVESDPPHRLIWHEDDGHDVLDVTYSLAAVPGGTRFTQTDEVAPGTPRFLHPLIRVGIGHDVAAQLKRLKRVLETL